MVVDPTQFTEQSEGSREPPHHFVLTWDSSKKAATVTVLIEAEVKTALKKRRGLYFRGNITGRMIRVNLCQFWVLNVADSLFPYGARILSDQFRRYGI